MIDFLDRVKEHIEGLNLITPNTVAIGLYDENNDSIALKPTPSGISERYFDKGKIYPFQFQALFHSMNNYSSYTFAQTVVDDLEKNGAGIVSQNNSYALTTFLCTTVPNFVQETNYGVLWSAIFEAELYIMGE